MFSKALIARNVWCLIHGEGLWAQVIRDKYIVVDIVEEWVKNIIKILQYASIIWKTIITTFPLVGNWLVWHVGKGDKVQIGLDPWIGSGGLHRLPSLVIRDLRDKRFDTSRQIASWDRTTLWKQN